VQTVQTMNEPYIEYWGLQRHPFLLAPDSQMMFMAGQYFECLERLKYAVNTQKGGALIVSEDAGLGKTTILLKLIEEMKKKYGKAFRYAFVDHPTLDSRQMISYIAGSISGSTPNQDKLKDIIMLKDALIEIKKQGGKAIIIVDEGQMLCGNYDVLQELRVLINLNYDNDYLHTFIFSGQKTLWEEMKRMPEFWQRLPIRYYFVPLRLEETREMIKYRLKMAGLDDKRSIFSDDAFEMIHRYAKGCPRTIIALADLSLLIGYADHARMIGFKEVARALNIMSGGGESLPYIKKEDSRTTGFQKPKTVEKQEYREYTQGPFKTKSDAYQGNRETVHQVRPFFIILLFVFFIIVGASGYHYFFAIPSKDKTPVAAVNMEPPKKVSEIQQEPQATTQKQKKENIEIKQEPQKEVIVIAKGANIRNGPDILSPRIGVIFEGEVVKVIEERWDKNGNKWYKFLLYGDKEGWVSENVVRVR